MKALSMNDVELSGKRVAIRLDLNVPIKNGKVGSDKRIRAALPTIQLALKKGAGVVLLSHLGRPEEGVFDETFSLAPVAVRVSELLGQPVRFSPTIENLVVAPGEVVLCENVRFLKGEKKNNPDLAAQFAALGDVYVMDAFGAAHRAHASTEGAVRLAKIAVAGPLMAAEMDAADKLMANPQRPLIAIIGGSKVSTKLTVLDNLITRVEGLIVGGGIANTFLAAIGKPVGKSLMEADLIPDAERIIQTARSRNVALPLPVDVVVAPAMDQGSQSALRATSEVKPDDMIFDIGPATAAEFEKVLATAATIVWNGPVGAFESAPFDAGTKALALALAKSSAYTVVCGGDSIAAVEAFNLADKMDYISTGGGAFLEVLEGKILPAVAALEARAK